MPVARTVMSTTTSSEVSPTPSVADVHHPRVVDVGRREPDGDRALEPLGVLGIEHPREVLVDAVRRQAWARSAPPDRPRSARPTGGRQPRAPAGAAPRPRPADRRPSSRRARRGSVDSRTPAAVRALTLLEPREELVVGDIGRLLDRRGIHRLGANHLRPEPLHAAEMPDQITQRPFRARGHPRVERSAGRIREPSALDADRVQMLARVHVTPGPRARRPTLLRIPVTNGISSFV